MFDVDENGIITNVNYHDLILTEISLINDTLRISLTSDDEKRKTYLTLEDVSYFSSLELVPKGIVMSCYFFKPRAIPDHLKEEIDLSNLFNYRKDEDYVFYADGSYGFEILASCKSGKFSSESD